MRQIISCNSPSHSLYAKQEHVLVLIQKYDIQEEAGLIRVSNKGRSECIDVISIVTGIVSANNRAIGQKAM